MSKFKPKEYQSECVAKIQEARNGGKSKALVVMAPGLGKTLTCAFDLQGYFTTHPDGHVLVLCHSEAILSQTKNVFKSVFGDEYSYGMYNGKEKASRRSDFLFANLQSVNLHLEEFNPDGYDYVVVDEAHHAPAETYKKAIEHFNPEFLLGMTATPDRMDGADLEGIFGETVYERDIVDAVQNGWLSGVDYRLELDEIHNLDDFLEKNIITLSQLNRELFIPKRDEEIIRLIRERSAERDNPTTVIFCQTVAHANHIAELMDDAVVIHSELPKIEQTKRLKAFRDGEVMTVCAVNMLNEGIDIPRTDIIVFLRVTQSATVFLQQLGRGLRIAEGKGDVLVLDFVANAERLDQIFMLEKEFKKRNNTAPDKATAQNHFTLNIDTSEFREKKIEILHLIEKAKSFRGVAELTNEQLIQMLKDLGKRLGRTPTQKDCCSENDMPSYETYRERFGSFENALRLAGYVITRVRHRVFKSRDAMLDYCRDYYRREGKAPGRRFIASDPDAPSMQEIKREFGSLNGYVAAAGCPVNKFIVELSDEEMLELLEQKCEELGRNPTTAEVDEDPNMPNAVSYYKRFGSSSLNGALELIGRKPNAQHNSSKWRNLTNEDLIRLLAEKQSKQDRTVTLADIKADPNMPGASVYIRRFKSFPAALALIGRKPNRSRKIKQTHT